MTTERPRRRVRRLATPLITADAYCEISDCRFYASGATAGRKARDHTSQTGHSAYVYASKTVYYEPLESGEA